MSQSGRPHDAICVIDLPLELELRLREMRNMLYYRLLATFAFGGDLLFRLWGVNGNGGGFCPSGKLVKCNILRKVREKGAKTSDTTYCALKELIHRLDNQRAKTVEKIVLVPHTSLAFSFGALGAPDSGREVEKHVGDGYDLVRASLQVTREVRVDRAVEGQVGGECSSAFGRFESRCL